MTDTTAVQTDGITYASSVTGTNNTALTAKGGYKPGPAQVLTSQQCLRLLMEKRKKEKEETKMRRKREHDEEKRKLREEENKRKAKGGNEKLKKKLKNWC